MPSLCPICKKQPATQIHHLNYEPEITIEVCVPCHIELHKHGVGLPKGVKGKIIEISKDEPEPVIPIYTKEKIIDDTPYIVDKDENVLDWLVCPNKCGEVTWQIFANSEGKTFIRCPLCGVDFPIKILKREKDA